MADLTYKDIGNVASNPARAINMVLSRVEEAVSGNRSRFESLSHPFPVALDYITAQSMALLNRMSDAESSIYPIHAEKPEDIFRHLPDDEYWGLFGYPSQATVKYAIPMQEIERLAVPYRDVSGTVVNSYRKLVIPKDTRINVYGIPFLTLHAIELRLMAAGHIQCLYDTSVRNPFFPIESNVLSRNMANINGYQYLYIDVPVYQMEVNIKRGLTVTPSAGLKGRIDFPDKLFGVRAFLKPNGPGAVAREIAISYNNQSFDNDVTTLVLNLNQDAGYIDYEMPIVYVNNETGLGKLNIVYYTTRGAYEQDLSELRSAQHDWEYIDTDYERGQLDTYSAPIKDVNNAQWEIQSSVVGGRNPRTFQELKEAYRFNARRNSLPVSNNQLTYAFKDYGYELVETLSYPTGRLFQLTREIPTNLNKANTGRSVGCFVGSLSYSVNELRDSGVVYDNGRRVTIPPRTLIKVTEYGNFVVSRTEIAELAAKRNDEIIEYSNNNLTVFTPFHYVLDTTNDQVEVRSYLLDNPYIRYQNFLYSKEKLGIELGVKSMAIESTNEGYIIRLITISDRLYKNMNDNRLGVQLHFRPADAKGNAAIKGVLEGKTEDGERIWKFVLKTNYDVDARDLLLFKDFMMYAEKQPNSVSTLEQDLHVLFLMEGRDDGEESDSDRAIEAALFEEPMMVIVEVGYRVIFGKPLDNLYTRVRPYKGDARYERYEENVPQLYQADTYKRDENGYLVFENEEPVLEHQAGEVMVDQDGNTIYQHLKGEYVYDDNGKLVELDIAKIRFHMDFFGLDGVYYFSTDKYDNDLVQSTKNYITNIIMQDMKHFADKALDLTRIMYIPKMKLGYVPVVIDSQTETTVRADLSFQVVFYLTKAGIQSKTLTDALTQSTKQIIDAALQNTTFAKSALIEQVRRSVTDDVIDFKITALSGNKDISVVTNLDGTTGFSVRQILEMSGEEVRSVKPSIVFSFVKHFKEIAM